MYWCFNGNKLSFKLLHSKLPKTIEFDPQIHPPHKTWNSYSSCFSLLLFLLLITVVLLILILIIILSYSSFLFLLLFSPSVLTNWTADIIHLNEQKLYCRVQNNVKYVHSGTWLLFLIDILTKKCHFLVIFRPKLNLSLVVTTHPVIPAKTGIYGIITIFSNNNQ